MRDKTTKPEDEAGDEGARSFGHFLQQIDDGSFHGDLSEELRKACKALEDHVERYQRDAKGTLILTISLQALRNGTVQVDGDFKTKLPKEHRRGAVFWVTKGGNLSVENPRQQKLPLREVAPPVQSTRDVSPRHDHRNI